MRYMIALAAMVAALFGFYAWTMHAASEAESVDRAIVATQQCIANVAYPRSLFEQCIDDYYRMRGWR